VERDIEIGSSAMPFNEADTRAKLIDPALHSRGWTEDLIKREVTAGAIEIVAGIPRQRAAGGERSAD
jgi:type I restriction enzyme R subunit